MRLRQPLRGHLAFATTLLLLTASGAASADPSTTTPEQGYDLGETHGARGTAMAGAHYALGTSTSAIYGNPANLPFARVYHLEAMGGLSPEARRQTVGAAIA